MTSKAMEEAQSCRERLCVLLEQVLEGRGDVAERMRELEHQGSIITEAWSNIPGDDASTIRQFSIETASMVEMENELETRFPCKDDLKLSRVYNKAICQYSQLSTTSTALHTSALSVYSKLSLSQVPAYRSTRCLYTRLICATARKTFSMRTGPPFLVLIRDVTLRLLRLSRRLLRLLRLGGEKG